MQTINNSFGPPILILQIVFGSVLATVFSIGSLDGLLPYLIAAVIFIATMGWWSTYMLIMRTEQFSLVHIFAFMTAVFFGAKAFTAWDDAVDWVAPMSDYIWTLVLSQAGLLALLAGARSVEQFIGLSPMVDWLSRVSEDVRRPLFIRLFLILLALQAIAYVTVYRAGLFLPQFGVPDIEQSYWITSLNMTYSLLRVIGLAMAVILALRGGHFQRPLGYAVTIADLTLAFISGRGPFIEAGLLCFVIVLLLNNGRSSVRRYAVVGIGLLVLSAGIAWPVYQHVRITATPYFSDNPFEDKISAMIEHVIPEAMETFNWTTVYAPTSEYRENLVARVGGADFPAAILASQNDGASYMYGEVAKTSLSLWIPRYFWPDKPNVNEEEVVVSHYHLADVDQTSSLLGFALADFGFIGVLSYMFAFGALLRLFEAYANTAGTAFLALTAFALYFPLSMNIEGDITRIGAILRISLVLILVDWVFFRRKSGISTERRPSRFAHGPQ